VNLQYILLLGHRQQHGKDPGSDILEDIIINTTCCGGERTCTNISYCRTFFAELLKKQVAERYGLDAAKMELDEYKQWCPPWVNPKTDGTLRTVRDILIEEGCKAREIWGDTWADAAYRKLFESGALVGIISDYRFPNEYACFKNSFARFAGKDVYAPKVVRILVDRPAGAYKNDGADGELPDTEDPDAWDYIIRNDVEGNGWKDHLREQILDMLVDLDIIRQGKFAGE